MCLVAIYGELCSVLIEFYSGLRFFIYYSRDLVVLGSYNFVMRFCSGFVGVYGGLVGLYVVVW